jgi:hypothetical protein
MGEKRHACRVLVARPVGKVSVGIPVCRRKNDIRMERRGMDSSG